MRRRASAVVGLALVFGSGFFGFGVGQRYESNALCCQVPPSRNLVLSLRQLLGLVRFHSEIGQDTWVSETAFPGEANGFFLDVGSGDGTIGSNTKALEEKGWTGICVDPFPSHMEGRTCQVFKDVVSNEAGKQVRFQLAGGFSGIADNLGRWKDKAAESESVELTTVTLADILERAKAPRFIHFISLDIEGAELDALRGFPFETYQFGALAVEHNYEETKRSGIEKLLRGHGYTRVHTWYQDDFYRRF